MMELDELQQWRHGCRQMAHLIAVWETEIRLALTQKETADALTRYYGQELIRSTMPNPLTQMSQAMLDALNQGDDE